MADRASIGREQARIAFEYRCLALENYAPAFGHATRRYAPAGITPNRGSTILQATADASEFGRNR